MTLEWLQDFLLNRGLESPDGRLLRDYDCTDRDYRALIGVLEHVGCPEHLRQAFSYGIPLKEQAPSAEDEDLTMSAFVLYGTEWFRRAWGGETKRVWERLMYQIGWSAEKYWELYPAMASGLAWWDHSFIKIIKTQYLGTFAYQAGVAVAGLRN